MTLIVFVSALAAFLVAALTTGQRLYWLCAIADGSLIVYALASVIWALATAKVHLSNIAPSGERGTSVNAILRVTLPSLLPVGQVRVILSMPSPLSSVRTVNMAVPPRATRSYRCRVAMSHRGKYRVGVTEIQVRDLFGIVTLTRKIPGKTKKTEIWPALRATLPLAIRTNDMGTEVVRTPDEDQAFPSDVRQWQDGDELKRVHWKLTMRRRELMVRTYEESARPDTLILTDLTPTEGLPEERLSHEDAICEATLGAAKAQLEAGCPVVVPLEGSAPREFSLRTAADLPELRKTMMTIRFDSPYTFEQVLLEAQSRLLRTGGVILVTARFTSHIADAAIRMQHAGVNVKLIWVTDSVRNDDGEMLEMLRMEGVTAETADPWENNGGMA